MRNYDLYGWNKWHHVVCSNGGIGSIARTYINGRFVDAGIRYEKQIIDNLIQNNTSILNIGAGYSSTNNNSWNNYFGIIDDIRLYDVPFGAEDTYHLYKGDQNILTYKAPVSGSLEGTIRINIKSGVPHSPIF